LSNSALPRWTLSNSRRRGMRFAGWDAAGNIHVEIVCAGDIAERIAAHLQSNYYANYAMVCYLTRVDVLRPEKC